MNNKKLKPCPFCGSEAKVMHMDYCEDGRVWGVFCTADLNAESNGDYWHGHEVENYATEEEAIAAWNTRHNYRNFDEVLADLYDWAYFNMEGCDEPEFTFFDNICGTVAKYQSEKARLEFASTINTSCYDEDIEF